MKNQKAIGYDDNETSVYFCTPGGGCWFHSASSSSKISLMKWHQFDYMDVGTFDPASMDAYFIIELDFDKCLFGCVCTGLVGMNLKCQGVKQFEMGDLLIKQMLKQTK